MAEDEGGEAEEIVENLRAAGFPEAEIEVLEDGTVLLGGDAVVGLQASREMAGEGEFRQYRTLNLVAGEVEVICVDGSEFSAAYRQALDSAIANYNELNLSFRMTRTNGSNTGCDAEIVAHMVSGSGGSAGFPEGGFPYDEINIGEDIGDDGQQVLTAVITHELGHCVGMRHSDWYNRSISCGVGGNESDPEIGEVHIPNTPTHAVVGGSIMNACYSEDSVGHWTSSDVTAMNELYGERFFGEPEHMLDQYSTDDGWTAARHLRDVADVDGDGFGDIVGFGDPGVYVSKASNGSFTGALTWVTDYGYDEGWLVDRHPRVLADVDGDDRADVVGFGDNGTYVSTSSGFSFAPADLWSDAFGYGAAAGAWRMDRHVRVMADVDGDDQADVVGFGNNGTYVAPSTGDGFEPATRWVVAYGYSATGGSWRVDRHPRMMADVNGDDRADVVAFGNSGAYVSLSTGSAFTAPVRWVAAYGYNDGWRVEEHVRVVTDVDGDDRADIVAFGDEGTYVSLSTGTGFTAPELWVDAFGYDAGDWRVDRHPRVVTDVDRDGFADIVGFGNPGVWVSLGDPDSFSEPQLWLGNFGYGEEAGSWRVDANPRVVANVRSNSRPEIIGFGNSGVWVSSVR